MKNLFRQAGLDEPIVHALGEMGFETPTPIQEKVIPHILQSSEDLIGLAQTGTGKTAAFGLPVIQQCDLDSPQTQILILSPTRELCLQITRELKHYSRYLGTLGVVPVYGGASAQEQIRALKSNAQVVVGTPGRVLDLLNRGKLRIGNISRLILDEADEMLSMGFKDELDAILEKAGSDRQVLLFSATMPKAIGQIARRYMNAPVEISVGRKNSGAENIQHICHLVRPRYRYQALRRVIDAHPGLSGIIFCRTRRETREVSEQLMQDGYSADALHGDLSQSQRDIIMHKFRLGHLKMLVATDVAARGIDVNDLSHIINYNLPDDPEVYIHRTGRTGRIGKKGIAVSLAHPADTGKIKAIEKLAGKTMEMQKLPDARQIVENQILNYTEQFARAGENQQGQPNLQRFLPQVMEKLQDMDREAIIQRLISLEFNRLLSDYEDAPDLNADAHQNAGKRKNGKDPSGNKNASPGKSQSKTQRKNRSRRKEAREGMQFARLFINKGKKQQLDKRGLMTMIGHKVNNHSIEIGHIDLQNNFTFFDIDARYENQILKAFKNARFNGTPLKIDRAKHQPHAT